MPLLAFALLSLSFTVGCASDNSPDGGTGGAVATGGASATGGSGQAGSSGTTGQAGSSGTTGTAGHGGLGPYALTVQNYLDWCNITENGTAYPASVPPVMSFAAGTVVNLNAVAGQFFVWGYWTGTDGDTTAAHDTNMTTTVTMNSDKTILACCPDPPPASQTCP